MVVRPIMRRVLPVDTGGRYMYMTDRQVLSLGGRDIEVIHTPGHTPGSVCFLDREAHLLFSGDTVCKWGILLNLRGESCPVTTFRDSMKRLQQLRGDFDTIYPGHHSFPVEPELIEDYLTCAQQVINGEADLGVDHGRRCARFRDILITLPDEEPDHG